MTAKETVLELFREALPDNPVVWTSSRTTLGDFDGREVTLEIFDVPWEEKRALLGRLRPHRERARQMLGRAVQLVFHAPEATAEHHGWVREEHSSRRPCDRVKERPARD